MLFGIDHYTGFVGAVLLFQLFPGAGTLTILGSTARGGIRAGVFAVLGTLLGDFLFMLGAVFGVATVLSAWPALLSALQWIGVGYLCWIGSRLLLGRGKDDQNRSEPRVADWKHFRNAFLVCLTNPKAIIFFMAFFPLFLTAESSAWALAMMMAHVSIISGIYQLFLVVAGNACAVRLSRYSWVPKVSRRVSGLLFLGFGVRFVITKR